MTVTTVVISQPMFFPWVGLFEQLRLADVWVHYDDVQFSKGSFVNRVQIKTAEGSKWLTLPLRANKLGLRIADLVLDGGKNWRQSHLDRLRTAYQAAPYGQEMLDFVARQYKVASERLVDLVVPAFEGLAEYFGVGRTCTFLSSSRLGVAGAGSQRVLDMVRQLGGSRYVTGHGAAQYLDHAAFEREGIRVEYIDYQRQPYGQQHGPFDPHVSILDLMANEGRAGARVIRSTARHWKEFLDR